MVDDEDIDGNEDEGEPQDEEGRREVEERFAKVASWLSDLMCRPGEPLVGSFGRSVSETGVERLDAVMGLQAELPDNDALASLGAFGRKTKVDKHTATHWGYLRGVIDRLDAAGHSDAADVLVWQVWHRVNTEARRSEIHRMLQRDRQADDARHSADMREAVEALYAFVKPRWLAGAHEQSDDVRRAVEIIGRHDPEGWAAHMAEARPC